MNFTSPLPSLNTFLATVTAGLTGTLVYHYLKSKFLEKDEDTKDSWNAILHVDVPRDSVAHLIGRDGMNIRQIEEETCTSISFIDSGGPCRMSVLRGSKDGVQLAKEKLLKSVEECAQLETSEISVSERTIDRLVAEQNQKLREIASVTKTKIYVDGKNLLVRGTYHEIEKVRQCLKEMANEEKPCEVETSNNLGALYLPSSPKKKSQSLINGQSEYEILEPTSSDGYCEVMISAVESPSKFFVQKSGPLSKELDSLIALMTDFYSNEDNRLLYAASKYDVGALIAVFVPDDKCWYRARVVSFESTEENIDESVLSVDIVDFGDRLTVKPHSDYVANLNQDFLTMRFQAVECTLADIKPVADGEWTCNAIEVFETLTYCIQWKIVMARIISEVNVDDRRIFSVKLVDTNTEKDVDIATELVRLQYATLTT